MAAPTLPRLEHAGRRPQLHEDLCHQATDSSVSLSCSFSLFMSGFLAPPASPPPPRHSHLHSRVHMPHPHTHTHTHARAHAHTQCTLASRRKAKLCSVPVHREPSRTVDQAPGREPVPSRCGQKLLGQPRLAQWVNKSLTDALPHLQI